MSKILFVEHVEFVNKIYAPCPFEELPVKALEVISIYFLDLILGNKHGVSLKKLKMRSSE